MQKRITWIDVREAQSRIRHFVSYTPCVDYFERRRTPQPYKMLSLKLENVHFGAHAFKLRGAANRLIGEPASHVVTAAIGSHGFAVGVVARKLGKKSTCFMPENAPSEKKEKMRKLVGEVIVDGSSFSDTEQIAAEFARKKALPFIHPYNDPLVIAGQGTIGLELASIVDLKRVYIPVGGGGLLSGIAIVLQEFKPGVEIIGVQPAVMHAMKSSVDSGRIVGVTQASSVAEPLCVNLTQDPITFPYVMEFVHRFSLPTDDSIRKAMHDIYVRTGHIVEGAGAAAFAAAYADWYEECNHGSHGESLYPGAYNPLPYGTSVCIVSGGNISEEKFSGETESFTIERPIC